MMMLYSLMECCDLLAVDAKTLRHWVRQANMPLHAHPTDARVKCLTREHVQQLAALHERVLLPDPTPHVSLGEALPTTVPPIPDDTTVQRSLASAKTAALLLPDDSDLRQRVVQLELHVASIQEQLSQLQLELAQERERRGDRRLLAFDQQTFELRPMSEEILKRAGNAPSDGGHSPQRSPHPAESRRQEMLPLIEYGAQGCYVVICPQEGELQLEPDSPQWFAWLASLSSFRFVGKQGRFRAGREYDHGPKRSWTAYRYFHQHTLKHYLGVTEHLTVACLEQMAAQIQSDIASR
jgi:hypothetical protein